MRLAAQVVTAGVVIIPVAPPVVQAVTAQITILKRVMIAALNTDTVRVTVIPGAVGAVGARAARR